MNEFVLINGRTVLPEGICENAPVYVKDGCIAAVNGPVPAEVPQVDAEGGYILPGFIDLHVHGGGGSDLMDATPEDLQTMVKTHCAYGTTAIVPTTMTCSDEELEKVIRNYTAFRKTPYEGAQILGLHLEGPYFAAAAKGAQPVSEERTPERGVLEHMLELSEGGILRWDAAPELPGMELFAQVMREHGVLPAIAHSGCNAETAARAFGWGFRHMTHFYNACTTFHKENGVSKAGNIEAAYINDDVTIELISDGKHVPKESMLLAYRVKGPSRIALITDAMRAAGTREEYSMLGSRTGGTPVRIRDGVAQLMDLSRYAGSICTMDRALRTAHLDCGIPLHEVSRMLSLTPAELCGAEKTKGSLEPGKDADIVVMDPEFRVRQVYVKGVSQPCAAGA